MLRQKLILLTLIASAMTLAAACQQPAEKANTTDPKAGDSAKADADKGEAADKGKATDKAPAANAGSAPAKNTPADKAAPAGDAKPAAPAGDLKLGQNSPTFLEGIEGTGQLMTTIETSMGNINCELYEKRTPNTIMNFVGLARGLKAFKDPATGQPVKRKFYDGIQFHRVIPNFMIQVGDPTGTGTYKPGYSFADEIDPALKHDQGGVLSMANAGPNTNGSQIFITEVPTPHLDGRHAVFGKCTKDSVEVIKKLARVATGPRNKPLEPLKINKVTFKRGQ